MDFPANQNDVRITNSSLCPCPDCDALISKRAAVCPKCGSALKADPSENKCDDISHEQKVKIYRPGVMNYLWHILLGVITTPMIFGIVILLWVVIEITCTRYELTTHRIIVRRGFISRMQNEIWIRDIRAMNFIQGIWQRIIGVGNISVGTAATAGAEISIAGVSNPYEIMTQINSLR
ncbi:MAG: hypothetical protein E7045_03615 [Lentisphaerae bacterium]|nr:hypothetical protein [Lentisphaerota bacterium]